MYKKEVVFFGDDIWMKIKRKSQYEFLVYFGLFTRKCGGSKTPVMARTVHWYALVRMGHIVSTRKMSLAQGLAYDFRLVIFFLLLLSVFKIGLKLGLPEGRGQVFGKSWHLVLWYKTINELSVSTGLNSSKKTSRMLETRDHGHEMYLEAP